MNTIGAAIKKAREAHGLSQAKLGELLEYKRNTVCNWETGVFLPPCDVLKKICEIFNMSADEILGLPDRSLNSLAKEERELILKYRLIDGYGREAVKNIIEIESDRAITGKGCQSKNSINLDFYIQGVSAGFGQFLNDDTHDQLCVLSTPDTRKADMVLRVNGDSMEPDIKNRSFILVKQSEEVYVGEIGVFVLNDEGYIKERGKEGLISLNKKYDMIKVGEDDDIRCVGKYIATLDSSDILSTNYN